ncbi:MAG: terpene cyclase/mutase family protein, partial [Pirellulaceae bacterium]|nr:terpene cyclase/mutase family protein [Pirellulaceae bacterium]
MSTKKGYTLIVLVLLALVATPVRGDISADQVRKSIRGGVGYLKKYQKVNGSWTDHPGYPGGLTALCSLAMINAGVPVSDPSIQRALKFVRSLGKPRMVYSTSLITMFLCAAEPDEDASLIRVNVNWLERIQIKTSLHKGSWAYSERNTAGDNSNSQFALLALHEAERAGVKVKESTWQSARDYWLRMQKEDGSWGYVKGEPSTGSMTCAGIASLLITSGRVHQGDAKVQAGTVHCCGTQSDDEPLRRAL